MAAMNLCKPCLRCDRGRAELGMEYCPECRRYEDIGAVLGDDEGGARYAGIVVEGDVQLQKGAAMPPRPVCARAGCKVRVSRRSRKPGTVWSECCKKECDLLWRRGAVKEEGPFPPGHKVRSAPMGLSPEQVRDLVREVAPVQNTEFAVAGLADQHTAERVSVGQTLVGGAAVNVHVHVQGQAAEKDVPAPLFAPPLKVDQLPPAKEGYERLAKMLGGLEAALEHMDEDTDSFTVVVTVFRNGTRKYGQPIFAGKPAGGGQ